MLSIYPLILNLWPGPPPLQTLGGGQRAPKSRSDSRPSPLKALRPKKHLPSRESVGPGPGHGSSEPAQPQEWRGGPFSFCPSLSPQVSPVGGGGPWALCVGMDWFRFPYPLLVTPPDIQQERRFQRDEKEISRKNRNTERKTFQFLQIGCPLYFSSLRFEAGS